MKLHLYNQSWIFKPRIFILFVFLSIATLVAVIFFIRFLFTPNTGLIDNYPEAVYYQGRMVFSPRALFSPAVAAGLIPGKDILIAVDNKPIHSSRDLVTIAYGIKNYKPFPVKIARGTEVPIETLTLEITPQFNLVRIDWLFIFLLMLLLGFTGFFLIICYPGNRAFHFLACACIVYLLVVCIKPFFYENILSIILIHIGTFAPWLLIFFCLYAPRPKGKKGLRIAVIVLISAGYLLFAAFRVFFIYRWCITADEVWFIQFRNLGKYNNIANGIAYVAFILLLWYSYTITPAVKDKNQYQWLIVGFIIALSIYYCIEELPFIFGEVPGERIGLGNLSLLFLIPFPLFFLFGLLWNKKIHFKTFQIGFLLHFLLLVLIFFFFFNLYIPVKHYLVGNNGITDDLAGFLAMLVLFVLLFPLYTVTGKLLKAFFYGNKYNGSVEYLVQLETANANLKEESEQLKLQNAARLQEAKTADFKSLFKGITTHVEHSVQLLKKGLDTIRQWEAVFNKEGGDDYKIFTGAVESIKNGHLGIKNFFERMNALFANMHSLSSFVDAAYLIRKALHICTRKYPDLFVDPDLKTLKKLYVCPDEIIIALSALLFNAYEAKTGHGEEVRIRGNICGNKQIIEIEDDGPGIPAMHKKRIFAPFFSAKTGHDGLGLYLAKMYIEKNSGTLQFHNTEPHGCVFTVTFFTGTDLSTGETKHSTD